MLKQRISANFGSSPLKYDLNIPSQVEEEKAKLERRVIDFIGATFGRGKSAYGVFTLHNRSTRALAKYSLISGFGITESLSQNIRLIYRFCKSMKVDPDQVVAQCLGPDGAENAWGIANARKKVEDYVYYLGTKGIAPITIAGYISSIRTFFSVNGIRLEICRPHPLVVLHYYRALTVNEIQRLLEVATIREKAMISILAVGGFRVGTLVKLKYGHVKRDLESNVIPVHVYVEPDITKGKYQGYSTFLNGEAVRYLKAYLEMRRQGTERTAPERIVDESPLIRQVRAQTKLRNSKVVRGIVHSLYFKAGLISKQQGCRRYEICTHSLRKFFRTELSLAGVNRDCIEYMMGHKGDRYSDVKSRGIEYLRNVYLSSGISLLPRTKEERISELAQIIQRWGLNPEEVIKPELLNSLQQHNRNGPKNL